MGKLCRLDSPSVIPIIDFAALLCYTYVGFSSTNQKFEGVPIVKKTITWIVLATVGLVCILFIAVNLLRPYNDDITIDALKSTTEMCDYILAQVSNDPDIGSDSFSYYEFSGTTEFSQLFDFDEWAISKTAPQGTPSLVLRFAEAWILELYPNGTSWAHNGYASSGTKSDCYYTFSTDTLEALIAYMKDCAVPHTFGDGVISMGTFHH